MKLYGMKVLMIVIGVFTMSVLNGQSNILEPTNIFNLKPIHRNEDSITNIGTDSIHLKKDNSRLYYIQYEEYTLAYKFIDSSNELYIETLYPGKQRHGLSYYSDLDQQFITLYDSDSLIGNIMLYNGKPLLKEFFRRGNIFIERFYDYKGVLKSEEVEFNECFSFKHYKFRKGVYSIKKSYVRDNIDCTGTHDIISYFSYLNYPTLKWFKSFTGLNFDELFLEDADVPYQSQTPKK